MVKLPLVKCRRNYWQSILNTPTKYVPAQDRQTLHRQVGSKQIDRHFTDRQTLYTDRQTLYKQIDILYTDSIHYKDRQTLYRQIDTVQIYRHIYSITGRQTLNRQIDTIQIERQKSTFPPYEFNSEGWYGNFLHMFKIGVCLFFNQDCQPREGLNFFVKVITLLKRLFLPHDQKLYIYILTNKKLHNS